MVAVVVALEAVEVEVDIEEAESGDRTVEASRVPTFFPRQMLPHPDRISFPQNRNGNALCLPSSRI